MGDLHITAMRNNNLNKKEKSHTGVLVSGCDLELTTILDAAPLAALEYAYNSLCSWLLIA